MGTFLVDVQCCGVKDAYYSLVDATELDEVLSRRFDDPAEHEVPAGEARHLVESAVAFAARYGLAPHSDYKKGCRVFGGLTAVAPKVPWEFGKNGTPFYIEGPYDSPAFCENVIRNLAARGCGHYIAGASDPLELDDLDADELDSDDLDADKLE